MFSSLLPFLLSVISVLRPSTRFLTEPIGIHMAFTEHQYEVSLVWTSAQPLYDVSVLVRQTTCHGIDDPADWTEVTPEWKWNFVSMSRMWEVSYRAILQDVYPECQYEYVVGSGFLWTPSRTFQAWTPYNPASPSQDDYQHPASFLVFGDLGNGSSGDITRSSIKDFLASHSIDAMLHLGDIAYNLDSFHPSVARAYFEEMEKIASTTPYMVVPGNHELVDNFTQYRVDFRMPVTPENEGSNYFYSFDMGRAHFLGYSSEHVYGEGSEDEQRKNLAWIQDDLTRANWNRAAIPWLFVMAHRPLYCSQNFNDDSTGYSADCGYRSEYLRKLLEDMFYRAGVDVVLNAHVHNYQRWGPVYNGEKVASEVDGQHVHKNTRAPLYILDGSAGNEEGNDLLSPTPDPAMIYQSRELSYAWLQVHNETHISWEQWDSVTGELLDYFSLEKTGPRYIS